MLWFNAQRSNRVWRAPSWVIGSDQNVINIWERLREKMRRKSEGVTDLKAAWTGRLQTCVEWRRTCGERVSLRHCITVMVNNQTLPNCAIIHEAINKAYLPNQYSGKRRTVKVFTMGYWKRFATGSALCLWLGRTLCQEATGHLGLCNRDMYGWEISHWEIPARISGPFSFISNIRAFSTPEKWFSESSKDLQRPRKTCYGSVFDLNLKFQGANRNRYHRTQNIAIDEK